MAVGAFHVSSGTFEAVKRAIAARFDIERIGKPCRKPGQSKLIRKFEESIVQLPLQLHKGGHILVFLKTKR
jgi:hypothetical protein